MQSSHCLWSHVPFLFCPVIEREREQDQTCSSEPTYWLDMPVREVRSFGMAASHKPTRSSCRFGTRVRIHASTCSPHSCPLWWWPASTCSREKRKWQVIISGCGHLGWHKWSGHAKFLSTSQKPKGATFQDIDLERWLLLTNNLPIRSGGFGRFTTWKRVWEGEKGRCKGELWLWAKTLYTLASQSVQAQSEGFKLSV